MATTASATADMRQELAADGAVDLLQDRFTKRLTKGHVIYIGARNSRPVADAYRAETSQLWFWRGAPLRYADNHYVLVDSAAMKADVRLIRSGGHLPKGGYDVRNGITRGYPTHASAVL